MAWTERNTGLINKWWLTDSISDSEVDAVFQFLGAKDSAESLRNWAEVNAPGTLVDTPSWVKGIGYTFDGVDDAIDSNITLGSTATVIILFNIISADGADNKLFGYQNGGSTINRFRVDIDKASPNGNVTFLIGTAFINEAVNWQANRDYVVAVSKDSLHKVYLDGTFLDDGSGGGYVGTLADSYIGGINDAGSLGADPWDDIVKAVVIYNRQLTNAEVAAVSANMTALTSATNLSQYIYWIAQHPNTKHLQSSSHELLAATEEGLYRTLNGGRSWAKLPVTDPSNAEFADSPAATVDELSFRWIEYDNLDKLTLYAMATKTSANRVWIYKSTDNGDTWTSRGVEIA